MQTTTAASSGPMRGAEEAIGPDSELPHCAACGYTVLQSLGQNPDFPQGQVLRCERCGFGQTVPTPTDEELNEFYASPYSAHRKPSGRLLKFLDARAESQFRFIAKSWKRAGSMAGKRVLDVGCGFGSFPKRCEKQEMQVTAWDPDPKAIDVARERLSPDAQLNVGLFRPEEEPAKSFDLIALSHVLEHVANPVGMVGQLLQLLDDRGVLFIEVPNSDERKPAKAIRQGFGGSGHLTFSTPASLRALIETAGGEVVGEQVVGPPLHRVPQRFGRPLNSFRRWQFASEMATRKVVGKITGERPVRINLDVFKPEMQDPENGIWLRILCRARIPEFDPKAMLWDCLRGDTQYSAAILQSHLTRQSLSPDRVRTAIAYLCKHGDPHVGLEMIRRSCKQTNYLFRTEQRFIAYRRLKDRYKTLRYMLIATALHAVKRPRKLLHMAKNRAKCVATASLYTPTSRAQRKAMDDYPRVLDRMRQLVDGKRVLIVGSGPSAAYLTNVPDDVVTFCINRAAARFETGMPQGKFVWVLGGAVGRCTWNHVEELSGRLPRVDWVLLEFFKQWRRYKWGAGHWKRLIAGWKFEHCVDFLRSDDQDILVEKGFIRQPTKLRFSNGVNLLKYLITMSPAEIYLAGIDLGYAGRIDQPHNTYFHEPNRFLDRNGVPLVSRQRQAHPLDEPLVREIGRRSLPVYAISEHSRAANYLPVKPLV